MKLLLLRHKDWQTDKSWIGELFDITLNGTIDDTGIFYSYDIELPWHDNHPDTSCIPEGVYKIVVDWSVSKQKWLPHLLEVPGREGIRIHIANFPKDIKGCIGVGLSKGKDAIYESEKAFTPLLERLKIDKESQITIKEV